MGRRGGAAARVVRRPGRPSRSTGPRRSRDRSELAVTDRERIARDLHDVVIQRLFATGLQLQSAALGDAEVFARIDQAVDGLDATIRTSAA